MKHLNNSDKTGRRKFLLKSAAALGTGAVMMAESNLFPLSAAEKSVDNAGNGKETKPFKKESISVKNPYDIVITGGLVYDGTRALPFKGNIAIKDGKIRDIWEENGESLPAAREVIELGKDEVVSPGFIDIHTHTDTNLLEAPLGDSRIYQGITSDNGGNCGDSPFPYSDEYFASKKGSKRFGYPFWQNLDGFFDALEQKKIGINYSTLTGQGQLRSAVVGDNNVPCTKEQLKKMCDILEMQLEMGSTGLSCGLEYAPGSYASDEELTELCKIVAKHNKLFAIHMRNEDDRVEEAVKEAIAIARNSGARLEISHLKAQNAANWHKGPNLVKLIEEGRRSGVDVTFDRYPYTGFSTGLTSFIPLNDRQGSNAEILARLEEKKKSDEIGKYARSRIERLGGPQNVLIAACDAPENKQFSGKTIKEICDMTGKEVWEQIRELLISEKLGVQIVGFAMCDENINLFFSNPLGMPASDGSVYAPYGRLGKEIPHPRSYGTFPRFFGKYVRENKVCDLQTAIYKCTGFPASRLGFKDRGLIKIGFAADIVIFNPNTIIDVATFEKPHQGATGISAVIVNGQTTIRNGKHTGVFNGQVLR